MTDKFPSRNNSVQQDITERTEAAERSSDRCRRSGHRGTRPGSEDVFIGVYNGSLHNWQRNKRTDYTNHRTTKQQQQAHQGETKDLPPMACHNLSAKLHCLPEIQTLIHNDEWREQHPANTQVNSRQNAKNNAEQNQYMSHKAKQCQRSKRQVKS